MRAIYFIVTFLLALAGSSRAMECSDNLIYVISEVATPTPTAAPTPTVAPTNLPTPTPTPQTATNWSTIIDHCWSFDANLNDSCSGATPINLVATDGIGPSYVVGGIDGTHYSSFSNTRSVGGSSVTQFAPVGTDSLTMWCFIQTSSGTGAITADGAIMGKYASSVGYELWIDYSNASSSALAGHEQNRSASIANAWVSSSGTGSFNFVWWRAKNTGAGTNALRIGRWSGSSNLNSAAAGTVATVADATTTLFKIGLSATHSGMVLFYDACGWDSANLADDALCRICSCGVSGAACTCNGASYTNEGRRTTNCGSCTLPACNQSTPTVF